MTTEQIECYLALVNEKTYAEAAEYLQIPQQAVIKIIKSLEKELSAELFIKSASQLVPTSAGRMLYARMYYILSQYRELDRAAAPYRQHSSPVLDVGSMYFAEYFDLVSLLHEFLEAHPSSNVCLHEFRANEISGLFNSKRLTCAFLYKELYDGPYSRALDIADDPLVVIMSRQLAGQYSGPVELSALKDRRFILLQGDRMLHRHFLSLCINAGFVPNELSVNARVSTVIELVQSSDAVSLLPLSFTRNIPSGSNISILLPAAPMSLSLSLICADAVPSKEYLQFESFVAEFLTLRDS